MEEDKEGPLFLKLLQELRIVFLQDAVVLKNKYPSYYLWFCALFGTDLYRAYESQLLQVLHDLHVPLQTTQRVQMSLPEMFSWTQAGLQSMSDQIRVNYQAQMNRITAFEHRIGEFFALGDANFNQAPPIRLLPSASPSPSPLPLIHPLRPAQAIPGSSSSYIPSYTLSRTIQTVTDVWKEYSVGLPGGGPSVKYLETQLRTKWREVEKESRFFRRRRELYRAIEAKAAEESISCEEAAERLEKTRIQLGFSLDQLRIQIGKQ